jgi:hypothetical protein
VAVRKGVDRWADYEKQEAIDTEERNRAASVPRPIQRAISALDTHTGAFILTEHERLLLRHLIATPRGPEKDRTMAELTAVIALRFGRLYNDAG